MKKSIIAAMFIAIGVALSTFHITIGGAKIFPVQHMINVILAVLVGARYNVSAAFGTSCLRNLLGMGSPLAFPGSMVGAFLAGLTYRYTKNIVLTACAEVVGTGIIGAIISYPIAAFLLGKEMAIMTLIISFTASTAAGSFMAVLILYVLERKGMLERLRHGLYSL